EVRNGDINRRIGKGQPADVAPREAHTIRHVRQSCIVQRCVWVVTGQCAAQPAIKADGFSGSQSLRSSDQQESTPAADVEDELITAPAEPPDDLVPDSELGNLAVPEHSGGAEQEVESSGKQHRLCYRVGREEVA